jgi:dsDNA-binding SOS-regulon protein
MKKMKKVCLISLILICGVTSLTGCETLKKKFTRKRKSQDSQEQVIIVPRDYAAHPVANDLLYKQYFTYWKSWNQELVASFEGNAHKKIVDCAQQSLLNLQKMASFLKEEKAKELGVFIKKTEDLKADAEVSQSMVASQLNLLKYRAERILSSVNRGYDLNKMKDWIK